MSSSGRRRVTAISVSLTVALLGSYALGTLQAPLPLLHPTPLPAAETVVTGDGPDLSVFTAPTAVGWADPANATHHEQQAWATDEETHPIASITKLITVLVALDEQPLAPGEVGPTFTVTAADEQIRERVLQQNGVVHDTPAGLQLSTQELLELILLPSSNNYAISYATWVFGSERTFLDRAAAWLTEHGLHDTTIVEPSGISTRNTATGSDLIRLARLALANPSVTEVTRQASALIPGIGRVQNTNPLIREEGVLGLKTGTTDEAGANLLAAQEVTVGDRSGVAVAVTLGREPEERAPDTREALHLLAGTTQEETLLEAGTPVGTVTTWDDQTIELHAEQQISMTLFPGESASLSPKFWTVGVSPAGATAGAVRAAGPGAAPLSEVTLATEIRDPGAWWRLTHPRILAGWFPE